MLMIEPPPAVRISGIVYFAISIIEVTLTRIAASHSRGSTSTAVPGGPPMPTLLTRMSSRPQRATVCRTAAAQSSGFVTSASTTMASPPSSAIIREVASTQSFTGSMRVTRAPCRASRTEAARPLPMPSVRPGGTGLRQRGTMGVRLTHSTSAQIFGLNLFHPRHRGFLAHWLPRIGLERPQDPYHDSNNLFIAVLPNTFKTYRLKRLRALLPSGDRSEYCLNQSNLKCGSRLQDRKSTRLNSSHLGISYA